MRKWILVLVLLPLLAAPARAMEFEAPAAPGEMEALIPREADSFGQGLWNVTCAALEVLNPSLHQAIRTALMVSAAVLICCLLGQLVPGMSDKSINLAGTVAVACALMESSVSMIHLGIETVTALSEYGKLLLPVMTGALAAQGGVSASAALYVGTAFFDSVLSSAITKLMVPMVYLFLALAIANAALGETLLSKLRDLIKWATTWVLKIGLYLFTGYMTVTGAVSGSADVTAVKAAKIAISGTVPLVGGILSDASEAVLVSAGVMRSAAGVYGLLTVFALFLSPFLQIGIQYLLLKIIGGLCGAFDKNGCGNLVSDFSDAMGLILAMVSTQTVLLFISTVCFMKGVS